MQRDLGVVLQQQGVEVKAKGQGDAIDSPSLEIRLDATAGRVIAIRRGAGRIRHVATPTLWLWRHQNDSIGEVTIVHGNKLLDFQTRICDLQKAGARLRLS